MESLSTRVERWLRDEIVGFGRRYRRGPSEALRDVAEEWWALTQFPAIEFRDGITGRRAGLRGGPDVWEIIMVWRDYAPDREPFYEHFGAYVSRGALDQALTYYDSFTREIDELVEDNLRTAARLESGAARH